VPGEARLVTRRSPVALAWVGGVAEKAGQIRGQSRLPVICRWLA